MTYVGEIRMFAGNFEPAGWAFCDGRILPISENEVLFQIIGTQYGGDGESTFALPDLRGRLPLHQGTGPSGAGYIVGQAAGAESVTLTVPQIPVHTHVAACNSGGQGSANPANAIWTASDVAQYSSLAPTGSMQSPNLTPAGGSQPHDNMMPYLCINFILSLYGLYPSAT